MEKNWNSKQIRLLQMADAETAQRFLDEFGPVIYTWMYYQVGADSDIALDLTGRTFKRAIENLSAFDPTRITLFQWLKDQATQSRDEGLEHWQMKPQRPWAWSQLPDEVLCGLSRFRSDPLNEETIANSFIREIVQAAMAELETTDRQLLVHRYCHLNTAEHIAEEVGCDVEEVQSQLYRSRHSFRRGFFQLIASANSGFSESDSSGEMEIQDTNLEKLLSTTTIYQELTETQTETLHLQLMQASREVAGSLPPKSKPSVQMAAAMTIFVVIVLSAGIYWMMQNNKAANPPAMISKDKTPPQTTQEKPIQPETKHATQDLVDGDELKQIFDLGQAGDVDALLEILKSGHFPSQRVASVFLGKLADPNAIDLLQKAEEQWYPQSLGDNPFAQAIEQILMRFPEAVVVSVVEEPKPEPKVEKPEKKKPTPPPAPVPNITGIVRGFANQPIENASVQLMENPLLLNGGTGRKLATVQTNPLGQYQFSDITKRSVSLVCRVPAEGGKVFTRSLWCSKDSFCIANIGGMPALTGAVIIDDRPLASQTLYLSDTLDISHASLLEEVVTDPQGNFSFLGVSPGSYSIMNRGLDNRIHRLATIEMPQRDTFNAIINIKTVTVWLDTAEQSEQSNITQAILVYAPNSPANLSQSQATLSEDGVMVFEKVISGPYVLKVQLDSGVWLQQNVEVTEETAEQSVLLDSAPKETAVLQGRFLSATPIDLFLTSTNQKIHIDISPDADGSYELASVPSDIYSLGAFVKGRLIEFMQIDLQSDLEVMLDIDPAEIMQTYSPLAVVVTDGSGVVLSDAQIWLTEVANEGLFTASTTGQGAFLAAPAGEYTLSAAFPGYPTETRQILLEASSLLADPDITLIQLAQ